jgi:hypothetical protein
MRTQLRAISFGASIAVLMFYSLPAAAETVNERFPVPLESILACNGETVILSGECHSVVKDRTDNRGVRHIDAHLNCHADGFGTDAEGLGTGNVYRFLWNAKQSFESTKCLMLDENTVSKQRLISAGSSDNLFLDVTTTFTSGENCEVIVDVDVDVDCRG